MTKTKKSPAAKPAEPKKAAAPGRRMVALENYREDEALCRCGCGKDTAASLMIRCQAFIWILERIRGKQIQHRITGPARCEEHQRKVYGITDEDKPTPGSYHMGPDRKDGPGIPGHALDGNFWELNGDKWVRIPVKIVARLAKLAGLFGGVGWKAYGGEFIHLDDGPAREW
jgi:hypothetical protein